MLDFFSPEQITNVFEEQIKDEFTAMFCVNSMQCTRATTAQSGYQPYCQISTLLVSRDLHGVSKKTMANKYVPSKEGFNSARKFGLNSFDSKLTWLHILDTFPFIATSRVMKTGLFHRF